MQTHSGVLDAVNATEEIGRNFTVEKNIARLKGKQKKQRILDTIANIKANENYSPVVKWLLSTAFMIYLKYGVYIGQISVIFFFYLFGCIYYYHAEGWEPIESMYFMTVTITTVGYGDFHPTTDSSRLFTMFYTALIGLGFVFSLINNLAVYIVGYLEKKAMARLEAKKAVGSHTIDYHSYYKKILFSIASIIFTIFIGASFFMKNEGFTFVEAIYWCWITTFTIGYGDLRLEKDSSLAFSIFYIIFSVVIVTASLGNISTAHFELESEKRKLENLRRKLDFKMIREMDLDGDGVDKLEFLMAMLVINGLVDKEKDIDPWIKRFEELDKDNSGRLDEEDIKIMEAEEAERVKTLELELAKNTGNGTGIFELDINNLIENPLRMAANALGQNLTDEESQEKHLPEKHLPINKNTSPTGKKAKIDGSKRSSVAEMVGGKNPLKHDYRGSNNL